MYFFITAIQPIMIDNELYIDLIGYTDKKVKSAVRIYGFLPSIMIMNPPPLLSSNKFGNIIRSACEDIDVKLKEVKLKDASFYYFDKKIDYLEIFSPNVKNLKDVYSDISKTLKDYYVEINADAIYGKYHETDEFDDNVEDFDNQYSYHENILFYNNIESPWRYTDNSLSLTTLKYYLSCKYNVPQVGWVEIDDRFFVKNGVPQNYLKIPVLFLNVSDEYARNKFNARSVFNILNQKIITPTTKCGDNPMILLSYDLETINDDDSGVPKWYNGGYIIAIGIGVFNVYDPKPYRRICLITKKLTPPVTHTSKNNKITIVDSSVAENGMEFFICKDEKDMILHFASILFSIKPDFVCTFNGYLYDDPFVYYRAGGDNGKYSNFNIIGNLLQSYSVYDFKDTPKYVRYILPEFRQFEIKIDGLKNKDNHTIISQTCISVDVYKLLKKLDPKRFSVPGSGKLDSMLKIYNVKDPFHIPDQTKEKYTRDVDDTSDDEYSQPIAQKTGLTIPEMNEYWRSGVPEKIYEVARYCAQDAYITGTLLIARSIISDYIEKAIASCTSVYNSFMNADGIRVNKVITNYAYKNGFAYMDTPPTERSKREIDDDVRIKGSKSDEQKRIVNLTLGNKCHDHNKILGGAVRAYHPGKHKYVIALDFSSMYPSQKEGSNIDSSTRVDKFILQHPDKFGLKIKVKNIIDYYAIHEPRKQFLITKDKETFIVEEFESQLSNENGSVITKKIYFVQNSTEITDTFNTPVNRKSLKGIMLFDLRQLRNKAKSELKSLKNRLSEPGIDIDSLKQEINRYKAKELSYKILCNSEYGASDSRFFSHYDPDIAAAVTCSSRKLIAYLKYILEYGVYIISETDLEFIRENMEKIPYLLTKYTTDTLTSVNDGKSYLPITWSAKLEANKYCFTIPASIVIYQDTDSNYYINTKIAGLPNISPNEIMEKMYAYNDIVSYLCKATINRNPINTGFEGAFLVCRYFDVKKRYYGFKWTPGMSYFLRDNKYLISIDNDKIKSGNLLDYVDELGIKVTGVDLTRRDTFRFINKFHLRILQEDLTFDNQNLLNIVMNMIWTFRENLYSGNSEYTIDDFSAISKLRLSSDNYKNKAKTECKYSRNQAYNIMLKLQEECDNCEDPVEKSRIEALIPRIDEQIKFYISGDVFKSTSKVSTQAELIDLNCSRKIENYLDKLNFPYYLTKLSHAISGYLIEYFNQKVNEDDTEKSKNEIAKYITSIFYTAKNIKYTLAKPITHMFKNISYDQKMVDNYDSLMAKYDVINRVYIYMLNNRFTKMKDPEEIAIQDIFIKEYIKRVNTHSTGMSINPQALIQENYDVLIAPIVSDIAKIQCMLS